MAYRLEFAADAERDFGLIFDHLLRSYRHFGESLESAFDHAESRVLEIRTAAERILPVPHRGERHDDILPGVRHLAIGSAIYWFDIDESRETVRVLAVFFGGQGHVRHMMARLLQGRREPAASGGRARPCRAAGTCDLTGPLLPTQPSIL